MAARTTPPRVYAAIALVIAELARSGIAKTRVNAEENYAFRGIDDVMARLAPLLAKNRLCILPRVLERTATERCGVEGGALVSVTLRAAFDIVCARDGSSHTIEAYGEALDGGDKATAKAMSAAFKYAMLQAFCIPVLGGEDADATTHRLQTMHSKEEPSDPVQGWEQWARDIEDMVRICESGEALDRVQGTYRAELRAASKRRPDLYTAIGHAVRVRRKALASPAKPPSPPPVDANAGSPIRRSGNGSTAMEIAAHG